MQYIAPPKILVQTEPIGPITQLEIIIPRAGMGVVPIDDQPLLRSVGDLGIIIRTMTLVNDTMLTNAYVTGNPIAPLTELQKISIQLYSKQWIKMDTIPILMFNSIFTEGSGIPWNNNKFKLDNWTSVDWNKSKLLFSNGTVSVGAPYSVVFTVEYQPYDANTGKEIDFFPAR